MHYYIDGYNLLFRILRACDDLKTQRNQLLQDLESKINLLELDATIVFDSQYKEDGSSRAHHNHLEIIFTSVGETADEYILQDLKGASQPSQHTVVTSDKRLAELCRRRLAKTESVEEFFAWLNKRCQNKQRRQKEPAASKKAEAAPLPKRVAGSGASVEECFDFYLDAFEKEAKEIDVQDTPAEQKIKTIRKKKTQKKEDKKEQDLSDMERWLKAFERKDSDS
jgi:uncharacterized protein